MRLVAFPNGDTLFDTGGDLITKPTAFVIGAGASVPYGMPTGGELLRQAAALKPADCLFQVVREAGGAGLGVGVPRI